MSRTYYVYKKDDGYPAIATKKQDLPLIKETTNLKDAEDALKDYLSKSIIENNTDVSNKVFDALKKSEKRDRKITKKIRFMLGLAFSDRMHDGRDISFDILLPIQFNSEKEATDNQVVFFARMEFSDKEKEVVINIYERDSKTGENKIIETIKWCDFYSYKCSITRKESIGKLCIDPALDQEPCAEKFDILLKILTDKKSFSLQCLAYWVEPAFENLEIRQW